MNAPNTFSSLMFWMLLAIGLLMSVVSVETYSEPMAVTEEQEARVKRLMSKAVQHLRCSEWARVGKDSFEVNVQSASGRHIISGATAIREAWGLGLEQQMRSALPELFDQVGFSADWVVGSYQAQSKRVAKRLAEEQCGDDCLGKRTGFYNDMYNNKNCAFLVD